MLSNGYISALLFINVITWSKRFLDSFCRFVCGAKLPSKLHKYSIYSMWTTFASHGPFFPLCFTLTLTLSVEVHPHMRKIKSNFYSRFASDDKKFIGEREKIHCGIQSFKVISFAVNSIYIKSYSCTWSKIFNKFNSLFLCLFPLSFFTLSHSKLICYRHITTQITEFPSKLHNGKDYQEINSLNQWHSTTNWFIWELLLFFLYCSQHMLRMSVRRLYNWCGSFYRKRRKFNSSKRFLFDDSRVPSLSTHCFKLNDFKKLNTNLKNTTNG